jgi:hypothetical protein
VEHPNGRIPLYIHQDLLVELPTEESAAKGRRRPLGTMNFGGVNLKMEQGG